MADIEIIKSVEYYRQNKIIFNKIYNDVWKRIAGPGYIGSCSYLFQDFLQKYSSEHDDIPTMQDFSDYYFTHTNPVKSEKLYREESIHYGRTKEELMALAKEYQRRCNNYTISLEQYYDDVINHVIVETYEGQNRELLLMEEYQKKGFVAEHQNDYWDKDLGVDFFIKRKDGTICDYIQCKPMTTFLGNKNSSLIRDRINFFHKEELKKKECLKEGLPYKETKFVLYDYKHPLKWCSKNGKRSFHLDELITKDGYSLLTYKDFQYI